MTMIVKNTLNKVNDDIKVQGPQGAGSIFLSSVLACCTLDMKWEKKQRINFHAFPAQVASSHTYFKSSNVICIDSPSARYNFWVNFFRKKILYEVSYYRYQGKKWIKSPFQNLDDRENAFWLLNQARFIDQYVCEQSWIIDWIEMLEYPSSVWRTINEFLESNKKNNFWTLSQWLEAVDDYRNTLPKKITINPHHVHWQIWAIGILQNQGITSEIDMIENFRNPEYQQWLYRYIENTLDYTGKRTYYIG
jgi:hypothetical protein